MCIFSLYNKNIKEKGEKRKIKMKTAYSIRAIRKDNSILMERYVNILDISLIKILDKMVKDKTIKSYEIKSYAFDDKGTIIKL